MSYKDTLQSHNTQLQQNNTKLVQAIEKANALPDAASDTVTVYIGTAAPTADVGADGDIYIVRSEAT